MSIHENEKYLNKQIFDTAVHIANLMFRKSEDVELLRLVQENIDWMLKDYIKIMENKARED